MYIYFYLPYILGAVFNNSGFNETSHLQYIITITLKSFTVNQAEGDDLQLYLKCKAFVWGIKEKSYFTLNNSEINGNDNFYSSDIDLTPNEVNVNTNDKFEVKLLVYAIKIPYATINAIYNTSWVWD